jgi:hypothetical protein
MPVSATHPFRLVPAQHVGTKQPEPAIWPDWTTGTPAPLPPWSSIAGGNFFVTFEAGHHVNVTLVRLAEVDLLPRLKNIADSC